MPAGIRRALLRAEPGSETFLRFEDPVETLVAEAPAEVPALLERIERAAAGGLWAVGFVGYEAAPGFDAALAAHPPAAGPAPLAAFSLFRAPREEHVGVPRGAPSLRVRLAGIRAGATAERFKDSIEAVRAAIAAGSTYQVNLSFPFHGRLSGGGAEEILMGRLAPGEAPYAALLEGEGWAVVSLSPELFFERAGGRVTMRPMKGTRPRGRFGAEDRALAGELSASAKDRAENLMIVDMIRNDLGRIAAPGSVAVERGFEIERYPTVWQMTSTVAAVSNARLPELFAALFPCASVTGAPKPATTRFIRDLEPEPRGVYCGAIGRVEPGGGARFAVAIRTLELDLAAGTFRYGVGSGITWDSDPGEEWQECLAKARVLDGAPPAFALFETMRWRPGRGIELLDLHLERLAASADFFGFQAKTETTTGETSIAGEARTAVVARCAGLPPRDHRMRLLLARSGELSLEVEPFESAHRAWSVAIAGEPVPSVDPFLFHKTTIRDRYDAAMAAAPPGVDEVLLVNEHGELTEGTRTNLFVQFAGEWVTPPLTAGLLPGVFREHLLRSGKAVEATLYPADLVRAHRIRLGSALRGWIPVTLYR